MDLTPEQSARLNRWFDEAVDLPLPERAALVEEVHREEGGEMAERLVGLLEANGGTTGTIGEPVVRLPQPGVRWTLDRLRPCYDAAEAELERDSHLDRHAALAAGRHEKPRRRPFCRKTRRGKKAKSERILPRAIVRASRPRTRRDGSGSALTLTPVADQNERSPVVRMRPPVRVTPASRHMHPPVLRIARSRFQYATGHQLLRLP